jgi:hypothetical protein
MCGKNGGAMRCCRKGSGKKCCSGSTPNKGAAQPETGDAPKSA